MATLRLDCDLSAPEHDLLPDRPAAKGSAREGAGDDEAVPPEVEVEGDLRRRRAGRRRDGVLDHDPVPPQATSRLILQPDPSPETAEIWKVAFFRERTKSMPFLIRR